MKWSSLFGGSQVRQGIRLMRSGWKSGRGTPALGRHGTGTFVRMWSMTSSVEMFSASAS